MRAWTSSRFFAPVSGNALSRGLDKGFYFYIFGNMKSIDAVNALAALAQETRLQAFRELVAAHDPADAGSGLAAGTLARQLAVPAPTLSFHLKELHRAGLVGSNKRGRSIIYHARLDTMKALADYLLEDCCGGAGNAGDIAGAKERGKPK